jgi:hypothetical protein
MAGRSTERSVGAVPAWIIVALVLTLVLQLALKLTAQPPLAGASDLPAPPSEKILRLAVFGDPVPAAKLLMLYLQAFDLNAVNRMPYQALDYDRLIDWLGKILALDPKGQYPLHAASRLYADVPFEAKQRKMLEFIYSQFLVDPNRRWPWLAHATLVAKHQLKDLPLARKYAAAIQSMAKGPDVPSWATQMEAFILEDMNELEMARLMIGGFIAGGRIQDPGELRFLDQRLKQLESRLGAPKSGR